MTPLDEIPGAQERPNSSRIAIWQTPNGETTIHIPPRQVPPIMWAAIVLLLAQLLLTLYIGLMLFFFHRSVLVMAQIAPQDIPQTLDRYRLWLMLGWLAIEAAGFTVLTTALRPMLTTEILTISPQGISYEHRIVRRLQSRAIEQAQVLGFHLKRDPQGMNVSTLMLRARGEDIIFAEACTEGEREWLASVGNALLRQL